MHIPAQFKQNDQHYLEDIILKYPFATLISHSASGLEADHIPIFLNQLNGKNILQGHIAKANPLWKNLKDESDALVVFNGPDCYISPNHYPTKKETGKAVPTWNYVRVHVKGVMSFIHDDHWKLNMINNLTNQHEATQPVPWSTSDAPEEYIQKMLTAIVGLEIEISSIIGQWKLSQNQPEKNKQGLVAGLSQESDANAHKIAGLIKEHATQTQ